MSVKNDDNWHAFCRGIARGVIIPGTIVIFVIEGFYAAILYLALQVWPPHP